MNEEFNKWWNEDLLTEDNPHVDGTPAFWAWEGWCGAVKAEREACAKVIESHGPFLANGAMLAEAIRARGAT